jgi:hypothetical protein
MSILSLLPSKNEPTESILKRYNQMLRAVALNTYYEGILLDKTDPEVQAVLRALIVGMSKTETKTKTRKHIQHPNKTENDRHASSYLPADERRRRKSEASKKVRDQMKGGAGRK